MTKKVLLSILLAIFLLCSVFGATFAYAEEPAGNAVALSSTSEKVASFSIYESYPTANYPKNTPIALMDGTTEAGTMSFNITIYHDNGTNPKSETYQALKVTKDTVFTLIPNSSCTIKKVIMSVYPGQGTPALAVKDESYQTLFTPTSADRTQIGAESDITLLGMQFGDSFEATEETPYQFGVGNYASMYIKRVYVIYESASITETVQSKASWGSQWLDAGDIRVGVLDTGYGDSGWGSTIKTNSSIVIQPAPGYVVLSVTLNSSREDHVLSSASYITGTDGLNVVKDTLGFTITGFEVGKDYTFGNKSDGTWYVRDITVTYIEHEHMPEDLTPNYDETSHWDDCICRAKLNEEAHDLVDGEITKQPGNGLPGEQLQTCQVCSAEVIKYLPCPITDSAITAELANQLVCNGKEQAQKVIVKVGDVVLEEGVDYTLSNSLQTNAGNYTLTITGIVKYSGERTLDFTIEKGIIARPTCDSDPLEYDGSAQSYWIKPDNTRYTISGNRQTEIGTYVAEVTLTEEAYANYRWEETDERTITYQFEMIKGKVKAPTPGSNTFTYNGKAQTFYLPTNASRYTLSGDSRTQTNAGTYTVTVTLNDPEHYQWKDGTEGVLTYTFTINKINVQMPVADTTEFSYTGSEHTYHVEPNDLYEITGNQQTNAGTHTVVVSLKDPVNYQWANGTSEDLTFPFVINKINVQKPVADTTVFTYTGSKQTYNIESNSLYNITNNQKTGAGTYTVVVSLKDPVNYQWQEGTSEDLTFPFVINKAIVQKPAADPTVFYYTGSEQTYYIEPNDLYTISGNKQTRAGNYKATVTLKTSNWNNYQWEGEDPDDPRFSYDFVINKAIVQRPAADPTVYRFNGQSHKYQIQRNDALYTITYTGGLSAQVFPGSYPITVKLNDNRNYVWDDDTYDNLIYDFTILKGGVDLNTIVFADKEVVFDGTAHSIEMENLSSEFVVTYEGNGQVNLGTYTITARISLADSYYEEYYEELPTLTATLSITKASVTKPTADTTEFIYNGLAQTYTLASNDLFYTISGDSLTQTNAGTYTITVSLNNTEACQWDDGSEGTLTYTFVIAKATYDMSGVVFTGKTVTYNGQVHALEATNLPAGVTVSYENNNQTNAGNYTVTANFVGNANYNDIASQTAQLVIEKATYDMSGVAFVDQTVTYTGSKFYLDVTGVPTGVEVTYENNGHSDVGEYTVIAKFAVDANHNAIANLTATLTINKAQVIKPAADTTSFVYTGSALTYAVATSDLYTVSGNVQTNAGSYTVEIALKDKANYEWTDGTIEDLAYNFAIAKATYDMSGVVFADTTVTYDGESHSILATNLPAGVTVTYENNEQTVVGTYTITANFAGDKDNYNAIPSQTATLTIAKAILAKPAQDTTNFVYTGSALTYTVATNNFYTVSGNVQTNAGSYTVAIVLKDKANCEWADGTTDDLAYNFAIAKATYDMSGVVFADTTVTYDGESHSILATNLPNGVTVAYTGNAQTEAGEYTITATFTGDVNYNAIPSQTAKLVIEKAQVEKPAADTTEFVYNAAAQTYTIAASNLYTVAGNVQTNAGSYTVAIVLKDKANYEWADGTIEDLAYNFAIAKATYDMTGVVFANKTVTYTGSAFSIEATNLPAGVTVAYTGNAQTEAGEYTITATFTGDVNYNAIPSQTAKLVIEKAQVEKPAADTTEFVYNAAAQTYTIAASNLYTVAGNVETLAGNYTVTVTLKDKDNYEWTDETVTDLTFNFVIAKATYDMSGVVFADKTVVYTGSVFSIEATNLPAGVTVTYENNGQTNPNVYTITAKFAGDLNYNAIPDKTAVLIIKNSTLKFDTDAENDVADDIIISAEDGIDPTQQLVVELIEVDKDTQDFQEILKKGQKVAIAYDVKLLKDGASVQPDGTLKFKILIPMELLGRNFRILHIHNNDDVSEVNYTVEDGYAVFESKQLSEFVFVYDMGSLLWVIIVLAVVALLEVAFLLFVAKKKEQFKNATVAGVYPPFVFGMFISELDIALTVALAVVVIALAVICIISAIKVFNIKGAQVATVACCAQPQADVSVTEPVVDEGDDDAESKRILKSFTQRLDECKEETAIYYNILKEEFLSYKKVKVKISFKHESFRIGKNLVARFKFRGKTLCLFLALNPDDYQNTKFKIVNMADVSSNKDVPTMYKINLPRRVEYAKVLIADLMKKYGVEKTK